MYVVQMKRPSFIPWAKQSNLNVETEPAIHSDMLQAETR
jgi:hypothetical protein